MKRNRLLQLFLIFITVVTGIASRKLSGMLPDMGVEYAGDICWSLMVFWLLGLVFVSKSTLWIAGVALLLSYFIEFTQFYHAPFMDSIRSTIIGGLILGNTFIWSDLLCYTLGVLTGVLMEKWFSLLRL